MCVYVYMSEKVANQMGTAGIIAVAAAATLLYSLWGASVLNADKHAPVSQDTGPQLALGK